MSNDFNFIIAIDPDCDKSGIAVLNVKNKLLYYCNNLTFPYLLEFLKGAKDKYDKFIIIVEAGWLNKSNWHKGYYKGNTFIKNSLSVNETISKYTGANHETGKKIIEMAKYYGLDVIEKRPLKKIWKGQNKKITHAEIKKIIPNFPHHSNSEIRDAALLAWDYANFPIKL